MLYMSNFFCKSTLLKRISVLSSSSSPSFKSYPRFIILEKMPAWNVKTLFEPFQVESAIYVEG